MSNNIQILPTTVEHIRMLVADLREEDRKECARFGVTPFKGIWRSYRNANICRSAFVGNRIAAIWGIGGSVLGFIGNPWVMTSNVVNEYPLVFATLYRREVREMLKSYQILEGYVDSSYTKSLQLMRIIGFKEREFHPTPNGVLVRLEMLRAE